MNGFTNAILTLLLGWLRTLFNAVWALLGSDGSGALMNLLRDHWKLLFLVLCVGGFVVDRLIYLIRWRPYYVWLARKQRRKSRGTEENEPYDAPARQPYAHAGTAPYRAYVAEDELPMPDAEPDAFATMRYVKPASASLEAPTGRYQRPADSSFAPAAYAQPTPPVSFQALRRDAPNGFAPQAAPFAPQYPVPDRSAIPQPAPYRAMPQADAYRAESPQPEPYRNAAPQQEPYRIAPQPEPYRAAPRHGVPVPFTPDASFAPTATYAAIRSLPPVEAEPLTAEPRFDDDLNLWNAPQSAYDDFAPHMAQESNLAAGMAPAFGATQPEPARYLQDVQAGYAPVPTPEQYYTPRFDPQTDPVHPGLDRETFQQNFGMTDTADLPGAERRAQETYPDFAPFPVAAPQETAAGKPRGLGALAQKARSFVSGEDERNPRSIHDLQTTVDMKNAFHAPVYPKKKTESEEE